MENVSLYTKARKEYLKNNFEAALSLYEQGLKNGEVKCGYGLGILYFYGYGVNKDEAKANRLFEEYFKPIKDLADSGDAEAQVIMAFYFYNGFYVEQNDFEAVKWYQKAADNGDADAQYNLGWCYENGYGVEKSIDKAVEWYQIAANNGNYDGQCDLGLCYVNGDGVEQSYDEAFKWFKIAADNVYDRGQYFLGMCYENGDGVEQSYDEAFRWYQKAADKEYPPAQTSLGLCYANGKGVEQSYEQAFKWFKKAADNGIADAQCNLGVCYENGYGVEKSINKAVEWYQIAADNGDPQGQCNLGMCYENGYGVEQSYEQAFKWYKKAAENNFTKALLALAYCYHYGLGVDVCVEKEMDYLLKAAEQDEPVAQYDLAWCYIHGHGVKKSFAVAKEWYERSANNGFHPSLFAMIFYFSDEKFLFSILENVKKINIFNSDWAYEDKELNDHIECLTEGYFGMIDKILSNDSINNMLNDFDRYTKSISIETDKSDEIFDKTLSFFIPMIKRAADLNDPFAEMAMGSLYDSGIAVEQDAEKATELLIKAASKGNIFAQNDLGIKYYYGNGVKRSYKKAMECFERSGIKESSYYLGLCYLNGNGVKRSYKKAVEYFTRSAEQGFYCAQYELGRCYELGFGVDVSFEEAAYWYGEGATLGYSDAQFSLAECYKNGKGVEKSLEKAIYWYSEAAKQGDEDAKVELAKLIKNNEKLAEETYDVANAGQRYDLFISWNHKDKAYKDDLVKGIENYENNEKIYSRYRAWESDRDADGSIDECIKNAIDKCKMFLIILSNNALESEWMAKEASFALEKIKRGEMSKKDIIVIYKEDVKLTGVFAELKDVAAKFEGEVTPDLVKNIREQIRNVFEAQTIKNYYDRHLKDANFKFALRKQYEDGILEKTLVKTLLSFEDGYLERDLKRYLKNANGEYEYVNISNIHDKGKSFYIYGEGGSGKSLYVSDYILKYCPDKFARINLIGYANDISEKDTTLNSLINKEYNRDLQKDELKSTAPILRARGEKQSALTLIFDGLDEINDEQKKAFIDSVRIHLTTNEGANDRMIFTSRTTSCFSDLDALFNGELELYELEGITKEQQEKLYESIKNNFDFANRNKGMESDRSIVDCVDEEQLKHTFFLRLKDVTDEISKNPMLLSNLTFIYLKNRGRSFPTTKYELIGRSVDLFFDELEDERNVLRLFDLKEYVSGGKLKNLLRYAAYQRISGDERNYSKLIDEYLKNKKISDHEEISEKIYGYLTQRSIIVNDKITHDIFTAFLACCYIYDQIYEVAGNLKKGVVFKEEGKENLDYVLENGFSLSESSWIDTTSDFLMKLDYETHALPSGKKELTSSNPSFPAFDETLTTLIKNELHISEEAMYILRELVENNRLYFSAFFKKYLPRK